MAWSSAALSASELALLAADKPILGGYAQLRKYDRGRWCAGANPTFSTTDDTDTAFPFIRALDGKAGYVTKPNLGGTAWSMLFDFYNSTDSKYGIDFDAVGLVNHDLFNDGVTSLTVEIADDTSFSSNLQTIATENPTTWGSDARRMLLDLHHTGGSPLRYSSVYYVRISMTKATDFLPEIGEVVFLRRRQLRYRPDVPFDPAQYRSRSSVYKSPQGVVTRYNEYGDQRVVSAEWGLDDAADYADLRSWWQDCYYGREPFVWLYNPSTLPHAFHLMVQEDDEPVLDRTYDGPTKYKFALKAHEQGPETCYQSRE